MLQEMGYAINGYGAGRHITDLVRQGHVESRGRHRKLDVRLYAITDAGRAAAVAPNPEVWGKEAWRG